MMKLLYSISLKTLNSLKSCSWDDYDEAKKILRRIDEAKIRSELDDYWDALIRHAKQTALDGFDIDNILARLSQALAILQAAAQSQSA